MNCLVTGGAGFIGHHLVNRLLDDGHSVYVIDNLETGTIDNLPFHPELYFTKQSILDEIYPPFKIDWIFHLAALPLVQVSIEDPERTHTTNVNGTLKLLLFAKDNKVKKFVFSSSSSVYGDQETPFKESATTNPLSPYAAQKIMGEIYCKLFNEIYHVPTVCLRYFNVYGKGMNDKSNYANLIPKFIKLIKDGKSPEIWGDGKQRRDYVYVDDVVNANILLAKSNVVGEIFNVGSGKDVEVNDLADEMLKLLKSDIKPIHTKPVIEPRKGLSDITKIKKLGWKPSVSLEEGLKCLV